MAVELPFEEVDNLARALVLQRQQVLLGQFDAMPPKERRAFVLASLTACEAALKVTRAHMAELDRLVKEAEAAADAVAAVKAAEAEVPLL